MPAHSPSAAPEGRIEPETDTAPAAAIRLPGGLALLHRDTHLLVIAKPAGLAVHPGPRTPASLEDHLPALAFDNHRLPVICHRLDRDTSGCLVLARHPRAVKRMAALFETGAIHKTYWALLDALPAEPAGTIDASLLKQSSAAAGWRMVIDPRGKRAITHWRVLDPAIRLVEFRPETGRTHQLRVHSASIGCPISGDPVYGSPGAAMRLHARALVIPYDMAAPLRVAAALPPDWPADALHFDRD
jgi:tRNA pseudouridine32 synthase/23S rRNA pseudouridine746 synthase